MKSRRTSEASRGTKIIQGEGPNWVLIAGGALLTTISIRLGYRLKQIFDAKQPSNSRQSLKVNGNSTDQKKSLSCHLHSNAFCFSHCEDGCFNLYSEPRTAVEIKTHLNGQISEPEETPLPLMTIQASEFNKENGVMWSASPDRLKLPQKPFHQSNSSDSPCVSESGSDIFSKREVIQKLRQQLKRRDDMILEMQDQISDLQNSNSTQLSHSSHLQSLLDAANRDLFESEREIQRLRKAIADHCVGRFEGPGEKMPTVPFWPVDVKKGLGNGYTEVMEDSLGNLERGDKKVEMLKREVHELKELIDGKDYLLQSYKEQKSELSAKIKELQQRLDSQLPNIL